MSEQQSLQPLLYEQPLTERMRIFLRIAHLQQGITHFRQHQAEWDIRAMVVHFIEMLSLFERNDVKGETLKELERHSARLARLQGISGVDGEQLEKILAELQQSHHQLQAINGKIGHELRDDDLLNTIRQRIFIPGGTCNFDLPSYHYWLNLTVEQQTDTLTEWLAPFQLIQQAIQCLLNLTRHSSHPKAILAEKGFYQQTLEPNANCQLVQVWVPSDRPVFPEISGSKHRINIRFLQPQYPGRPQACHQSVEFQLNCCVI